MRAQDLGEVSLLDLFGLEAEAQTVVLTSGLLALERDPAAADQLESCMRAAHSLKGAASIVGLTVGVRVAHAMEDCFVAVQQGRATLRRAQIDVLLGGADLLTRISKTPEADIGRWADQQKSEVDGCLSALSAILHDGPANAAPLADSPSSEPAPQRRASDGHGESDRVLRVTAENLNRLLGLAGESLVESRWLKPFGESLLRLKRLHHESAKAIDNLREAASKRIEADEEMESRIVELLMRVAQDVKKM